MNLYTFVKMSPAFFMLCSGFFHFTLASYRLRIFNISDSEINWNATVSKCNETNASPVTWYDKGDAIFTNKYSKPSDKPESKSSWLGLTMSQPKVSTWSNGANLTFSSSNVTATDGEQICEAIENSTWRGFNCSDRKAFMCYKGSIYTLIEDEPRNWCQAQLYCRKHFTDLVSISDHNENQQVIEKGNGKTFWIGLMHDQWEWMDKSCSTFREWIHWSNDHAGKCTTEYNMKLFRQDCSNEHPIVCSKGSVRIQVINQNLTWEQAFDYCKANHSRLLQIEDASDQEAVIQWLNYTQAVGVFWIGLRQSHVFGFWIWGDKTVSESHWKNDKIPEMPMSNHCGAINATDYKWSDQSCWLQLPFICEEEISYMREN